MISKLKTLCVLMLIVNSNVVWASQYVGTVRNVVCHSKNITSLCQVRLNRSIQGSTCATTEWTYVFDGSTIEGKNLLSILISAQVSKSTVVIGGTGSCSLNDESEDIRHIFIDTP
ncbi:hypothetical protein [Vibrio bivalvicida]|uniref:hypothetical protein n=1 Tax=Vibrio bivalvicida TaxID=1276888 RepID=UPI0012FA31C8|nr:hypothetical protein [Vibrio bivalvicida]